jgi:hypothetical protein
VDAVSVGRGDPRGTLQGDDLHLGAGAAGRHRFLFVRLEQPLSVVDDQLVVGRQRRLGRDGAAGGRLGHFAVAALQVVSLDGDAAERLTAFKGGVALLLATPAHEAADFVEHVALVGMNQIPKRAKNHRSAARTDTEGMLRGTIHTRPESGAFRSPAQQ